MTDDNLSRLLEEVLRIGRNQEEMSLEYRRHIADEAVQLEKTNQRLGALEGHVTQQLTAEEREFIRKRMAADDAMTKFWTDMRMKLLEKGVWGVIIIAGFGTYAFVQYKLTGTVPTMGGR